MRLPFVNVLCIRNKEVARTPVLLFDTATFSCAVMGSQDLLGIYAFLSAVVCRVYIPKAEKSKLS